MSDPVRPATWEEVEQLRECYQHPLMDPAHVVGLLTCLGPHLLALIDQMADLLHDVRQEPGYALGLAEERREVLDLVAAEKGEAHRQLSVSGEAVCVRLAKAIAACGDPSPLPPPQVLRDENKRLREALGKCMPILADLEWSGVNWTEEALACPSCDVSHGPTHRKNCALAAALDAARQLMPDVPNPQ